RPDVGLVLDPAQQLEGTVTAADTGKPLPGARIFVEPMDGHFMSGRTYNPADERGRRFRGDGVPGEFLRFPVLPPSETRADAEGRFQVNPWRSKSFTVTVSAPPGEPYLSVTRTLDWPRGAVKQQPKFALPRGVLVRGKVIDQESGQGVVHA